MDEFIRSGVISDAGMIYFDVRPSAHLPTLELRVCDACPRLETVVLIAGLFRALVATALERLDGGAAPACGGWHEWLRGASWRAARSDLEGVLVDPETRQEAPAPQVVRNRLTRLRPALEDQGDWRTVRALAEAALADGSAAHRMRRAAQGADLLRRVDMLIAETRGEPYTEPGIHGHRRTVPPECTFTPAVAPGRSSSDTNPRSSADVARRAGQMPPPETNFVRGNARRQRGFRGVSYHHPPGGLP